MNELICAFTATIVTWLLCQIECCRLKKRCKELQGKLEKAGLGFDSVKTTLAIVTEMYHKQQSVNKNLQEELEQLKKRTKRANRENQ